MILVKGSVFQEAATGMAAVLGSMDTLTKLTSSVWDMITSNPLLTLFLAVCLIGVGVRVFMSVKRAAKR